MKERPILFSGAMVRALLAGTKTQTRRVMNQQPIPSSMPGRWQWVPPARFRREHGMSDFGYVEFKDRSNTVAACGPYGSPGDRLWVREAFRPIYPQQESYNGGNPIGYDYREGYQLGYRMGDSIRPPKWKPGIHMPREACRIVLEIVSVRIERLNDISEADAIAEGVARIGDEYVKAGHTFNEGPNFYTVNMDGGNINRPTAVEAYSALWEYINGEGSWGANPWVWVIEFKRVDGEA